MSTRAGRKAELQTQESLPIFRQLQEAGALHAVSLDLGEIFKGHDLGSDGALELWGQIGEFLGLFTRASKWWVADWLNFGEDVFTEDQRYAQMMEATGLSLGYLSNVARVGRSIAPSRRMAGVPFSLHEEVYTLPPAEQSKWLREASGHDPVWTQRELRDAIKASTQQGVLPLGDEREPQYRPNATRVLEVAGLLYNQARVNGAEVIVPLETYRQLEAALGKGE